MAREKKDLVVAGIKMSKSSHNKHLQDFAEFCLKRNPHIVEVQHSGHCAIRLILADGGELTCADGMIALRYRTAPYGEQWALFAEEMPDRTYDYEKIEV